jgi:DNA repair exonuclease SbcCD ATPase subunit
MIKFKTVRYKNFLSTGNKFSEIQIDGARTNLMVGANGAGKSTFMDAISFGLFGKPFRKVKLGQLVNSINQKNCEVELEFDVSGKSYLIKRGLKPAKFEIYVNGAMNDQMASARDSQDFLERYVLRMNERSFRQIVVLGSGSFTPFMRLGAGDRRSIIEELLDIQIFSIMNDLVKGRVIDNKNSISEVLHQIELLEQKIKLQESHIKILAENDAVSIKRNKEELKVSLEQVATITGEIKALKEQAQDYDKKTAKRGTLFGFKNKFKSKQERLNNSIESVDKDECPECLQGIPEEHKHIVMNRVDKELQDLSLGLSELETTLSNIDTEILEMENILQSISEKQGSITGINEYISKISSELSEQLEKDDRGTDQKEIDDTKIHLDEKHTTKYSLQESKHHLNTTQELLKDNGIKTVIIRNYLPLINQLINKYLQALNFNIAFELDEAFNETIKSRGRDAFQYGSFSEGEKLRIDLALLFCWREVAKLKNSVATNLLILDEIFDSSLDSTGIEDFLGILNSLDDNTNAFVISHKGDQIIDKFGRVISVEKAKNFSNVVTN